ncbi:Serum paraoxonase/arylesterase family protein [Penicillium digitatum]|uniref:Serum paraoxonase/arylesterase family protein n=3 Tax=Penicillium digitatum TaxID=36651 RepID=K9GPZ0_PEND2|nr:Serum paraoxonase/arylesterase family protein [Penicillium digitatum Pd1]EKV16753.1 Serum paraoxonase/arylesterase family protein [Penicillium digitatum PHI26]EKV21952.1 Serum paraoxonase/arylesterase family protein [Penicillium digitatum Pd1]KAG0154810.1 hypothetical protein PDIDSM_380 [Penicillium digitatum]QQK47810.1 Serum paraoxonase/arylesterase family protein [Penicillium digitatum]
MGFGTTISLGLVALIAFLAGPILHLVQVAGVFLTLNPTVLGEGQGPIQIEDTIHCEDVHHYLPANLLFTACEDDKSTRFSWFPPLGHMLPRTTQGSIHVVDPKTMKSTRLAFENFQGPFSTHGIDVIEDLEQADAVYVYAVNHLPNAAYSEAGEPKAGSQIELFHHILNSNSIRHVRSINHPLIKTPNDIYAISPISFYVTNDHFYREGPMRLIEDFWRSAKWSNIIHVQIADLASKDAPIEASVALTGLWNNNGLGHGRTDKEIIICSAMGGEMFLATQHESNHSISVDTSVSFNSLADNPSYYHDPYRTDSHDASGFLVAGVSQVIRLTANSRNPDALDPIQVWHTALNSRTGVWEKKLLFEDDGSRIRTASAAVLVPIEPKVGGEKLAWLFVTGFMSESMVAVQVEL